MYRPANIAPIQIGRAWCTCPLCHVVWGQLPRLPRRDDIDDVVALLKDIRSAPQETDDSAPLGPALAAVTTCFGEEVVKDIQRHAYIVWVRTGEARAIGANGSKFRYAKRLSVRVSWGGGVATADCGTRACEGASY